MAISIRTYYKQKIIMKVPGKRLTYKFGDSVKTNIEMGKTVPTPAQLVKKNKKRVKIISLPNYAALVPQVRELIKRISKVETLIKANGINSSQC